MNHVHRLILISVALLSFEAGADTITGTAGAGFQGWSSLNLDSDGKPYWDDPSFDGPNQSIGYLLTNLSPSPLPGAPGAIQFWGNTYNSLTDTGGTPDLNFFFNNTGSSAQVALQLEISAHSASNEFGWYDTTNPGVLNTIFPGTANAGAVMNVALSPQYGFYLRGTDGNIYRTQSSLNPAAEQSHQHFSLFRQSASAGNEIYWLGVEDLSLAQLAGGEGVVGDYNDMVIRLACVPEGSSFSLLIVGVFALFFSFRARLFAS